MRTTRRRGVVVAAAALTCSIGACSPGPDAGQGASGSGPGAGTATRSLFSSPARTSSSAPTSASTPRSASSSSYPGSPLFGLCGPPGAPSTAWSVRVSPGNVLTGIEVGSGPTAAVFVHESGSSGLCGFATYAPWLARQHVHAVLLNLCGYGRSRCRGGYAANLVAQTSAAVRWARANGARRVTLVGASMGGTVVMAASGTVHADAVVDLSGPLTWDPGMSTVRSARTLRIPALVVCTPGDPDTDYATLRRATGTVRNAHARFVTAPDGHGWDVLESYGADHTSITGIGALVGRWVRGAYR